MFITRTWRTKTIGGRRAIVPLKRAISRSEDPRKFHFVSLVESLMSLQANALISKSLLHDSEEKRVLQTAYDKLMKCETDMLSALSSIENDEAYGRLLGLIERMTTAIFVMGTLDRASISPKLRDFTRGSRARNGRTRKARAEIDRLRPRIVAEISAHPTLSDGEIFNRFKGVVPDERKPSATRQMAESDRKRVKAHIATVRLEEAQRRS